MIDIVTVGKKEYYIKKAYPNGDLKLSPVNRIDDLRSELKDYTSEELMWAAVQQAKETGSATKFREEIPEDEDKFKDVIIGKPMNFFTGEVEEDDD